MSKWWIGLYLLLSLQVRAEIAAPLLHLKEASRLSWPGNFQPSGLSLCQDHLLTVSDRHDLEIFSLDRQADGLRHVAIYRTLKALPESPPQTHPGNLLRQLILNLFNKQFDWEGISCDDQGNLYLASEAFSAILQVPPQQQPSWFPLKETEALENSKLLQDYNAGIEGVIWLGRQQFLIAAERSPAGLIRCQLEANVCVPDLVEVLSKKKVPKLLYARQLSGLTTDKGAIYTLERYVSRICRRRLQDFGIEACVSYRDTEMSPNFRHIDVVYGEAEGLAISDQSIYIIIDNNGRPLAVEPESTDTWLFEFERPAGF